jgi:Zn-dependent peptidase ImmA (M78 family)
MREDERVVREDVKNLIIGGEMEPSDAQIVRVVESLLRWYKPELLKEPACVEVDELAEFLGFKLRYELLSLDAEIMGVTCFTDTVLEVYDNETRKKKVVLIGAKTVVLNTLLTKPRYRGRYAFTVAHEIAHIIFDNADIRELKEASKKRYVDGVIDCDCSAEPAFYREHTEDDEREAKAESRETERLCDRAASAILMPDATVKMVIRQSVGKHYPDNGCGVVHIRADEKGRRFVLGLVEKISQVFDVSREAAGYKLAGTRLVRGARDILETSGVIKKRAA